MSRPSWLQPWRQPAPWLALLLLAIAAVSSSPRLWFWLALLLSVHGFCMSSMGGKH